MKTTLKLFSFLFVMMVAVSACSKDDDPADNDFFVDDYKGDISYTELDGDGDVSKGAGTVWVSKVGDTYSFRFDRGIPNITGIKMEKGSNTKIFFNDEALGSITIDNKNLDITYSKDKKIWTAQCTRD